MSRALLLLKIPTDQGAGVVGSKSSQAGSVSRTVAAVLNERHSAMDAGAKGDGATSDFFALQTFGNAYGKVKIVPGGTYNLGGVEWKPPAQDMTMIAGGDVSFPNGLPDLENLVPFQSGPGPIWSQIFASKTYGSSWLGAGNIFQIGSHVTSNVAAAPVVAVFGQGRASAPSSKVWGGNFVAYADNAVSTAIGIELNCGVMAAGGLAYGMVIASAGTGGQPNAAIQIQSNNVASQFVNGLFFRWRATEGLLTGSAIAVGGDTGATCQHLLFAYSIRATGSEIDIPSLVVGATPATVGARLSITAGGSDSVTARVGVDTAADDGNVQIRAKGAGQSQLADGAGNVKVAISSVGLAFHGTPPVAKQTITGSRSSGAALADLLTKLASIGLIIDGTSA
ncbi:hypothetical protein CP98_03646 [Sphingobium yanoikuyae]|uniref:Pectate lyase superfamily protein domain-containing protein n=1 Tax=Sphingobium yanoikuyae TaxID=13690 RepID=A0A084EGQ6_SPHYA|nr:hypothetical protein [Sphingobium yanoikuyae]KEZ17148.1 hypothetical protein CP98_03646 [Sphingobium yanoikuyae]